MDVVVAGRRQFSEAEAAVLDGKLPAPKEIHGWRDELKRIVGALGDAFKETFLPKFDEATGKTVAVLYREFEAARRVFKKEVFRDYAERVLGVILQAIDPDVGFDRRTLEAASTSAVEVLDARARHRARRKGLDQTEENLLNEKYGILGSDDELKLIRSLVSEAVRDGVRAGSLLLYLGATAAIIAGEVEQKRRRRGERELAELSERQQGMVKAGKAVSGSEMTGVIGVEDVVEKLGLESSDAEELLLRLQGSEEFRRLMRRNPRLKPSSVLVLAVAYNEAERAGMQPDRDGKAGGDAETITFPGAETSDRDQRMAA